MNLIYRGQNPPKNTNVLWIKDNQIYAYINEGWQPTSADIPIDDALIPDSENPVQSQVIQEAETELNGTIAGQLALKQNTMTFDSALSESSTNTIKNKAIYNQYMTEEDAYEVCDIVYPGYDEKEYRQQPLTLTALEDGIISIRTANGVSGDQTSYAINIYYKKNDDADWTYVLMSTVNYNLELNVVAGDTIKIGGNKNYYCDNSNNYYRCLNIKPLIRCNLSGNIMSLVDKDNFKDIDSVPQSIGDSYNFAPYLFSRGKIVNAENFIIPAANRLRSYRGMFRYCDVLEIPPKKLSASPAQEAYQDMFGYCTALTKTPKFLFEIAGPQSCRYMFEYCSNLTTTYDLTATTLNDSCYYEMFRHCTSLTSAPKLYATTLADSCYAWMFEGCTHLTAAPDLLATTVVARCYQEMFYGCTSLSSVKCMVESYTNSNNQFSVWLYNVSSTGTFIKNPLCTNWDRSANGIPSEWTVVDAT